MAFVVKIMVYYQLVEAAKTTLDGHSFQGVFLFCFAFFLRKIS